jgi:arginine utilization protein RocB
MKTTMKNHPFCSKQLKEMVDQLEGYRVHNLSLYHEAASNTRDARESLISLIRDDEKRRLVFSEGRYDSMVESGIEHLQERRRCEKERLEQYVDTDEKAIAARTIQRDKATEERGGSKKDRCSRMVYIPPPDHKFD